MKPPTLQEQLDQIAKKKPDGMLAITWKQGGEVEVFIQTLPIEIQCYMHHILGSMLIRQLNQGFEGGVKKAGLQ